MAFDEDRSRPRSRNSGKNLGLSEMRICALMGSNTASLLSSWLDGTVAAGHRYTRFDAAKMRIGACLSCMKCKRDYGSCIQHEDMARIYTTVLDAEVIVFASPLYGWNFSGAIKNILERLFALPYKQEGKPGILSGKKLQ